MVRISHAARNRHYRHPGAPLLEARTKTPLSERATILHSIGERVILDKLQGPGYIRIEQDNIMTIYKGNDPDSV